MLPALRAWPGLACSEMLSRNHRLFIRFHKLLKVEIYLTKRASPLQALLPLRYLIGDRLINFESILFLRHCLSSSIRRTAQGKRARGLQELFSRFQRVEDTTLTAFPQIARKYILRLAQRSGPVVTKFLEDSRGGVWKTMETQVRFDSSVCTQVNSLHFAYCLLQLVHARI